MLGSVIRWRELSESDLAEDVVLHPLDDVLEWTDPRPGKPAIDRPATTEDAVELVSAGVGLLVAPQSLARLHHRKDLTYRPLPSAPTSQVALSWPEGETSELMEQFIGIVRGRTVNSSRGSQPVADKSKPAEKPKPAERRKPAAGASRQRGSGAPKSRGKPAAADPTLGMDHSSTRSGGMVHSTQSGLVLGEVLQ